MPDLERADRLLQALLEGSSDRHDFADGFHLGRQSVVDTRKFLEREARDLRDHVVDRRFKARGRLARDVVANLVERVADRELRGDLRNREARRLRGQRRGARNAGIHLDHDDRAVLGIDGELDVGATRVDTDFPDDCHRCVAHLLVFAIRQRLRRRNRDRISRVHAHRVEVFDRTDDHDVVGRVAHHLELVFLPAEHALLDQALVARRLAQRPLDVFVELLIRIGDAATGAAEREARPDDRGKLRVLRGSFARPRGLRETRDRQIQTDVLHRGRNRSRSSALLIDSSCAPIRRTP